MLDVRDLTVRYYNRSKPSVSDVTLHLAEGEFVVLGGDSASGKSTLVQTVCGFIPWIIPAEVRGDIKILDKRHDDPTTIARTVCMVQQDPETQFCTETVEEEVAFGPENLRVQRERIREVVDSSLLSVNASHLKLRKLSTLSGGEKQKVAIASMLALEPKLLILDEPTSSLDPKSVREVVSAIELLRRKERMTTVVVEHRVNDFVDMASRVILMKEGRVVDDLVSGQPSYDKFRSGLAKSISYVRGSRSERTAIEAEGLSYGIAGTPILDNVCFSVREGAVVALMGENGAGKTTLLRLLMGLARPQEGKITIFNHTITASAPVDPWLLGRDIGFVFQNPNHQLFENSVEREIRFASLNYRTLVSAADAAIARFENSEEVSRHVHPNCLSFGQKRRVNILSSSSHGPRLVMLDEPFIGQDRNNSEKIVEMIAGLQKESKTVIVVTHDIDFAVSFCTDIVLMKRGRLLVSGAAKDCAPKVLEEFEGGEAEHGPGTIPESSD